MSIDRDPNAIRLPDDVAQRLLARAAELDERRGRTSIDQLRRGAAEAGISPAAFDSALAELARGELGAPGAGTRMAAESGRPWITSPLRRRLLTAVAALASILLGIGIVRGVTGPDESRAAEFESVEVQAAPAAEPAVDVAPPGDVRVDVAPAPAVAQPAPTRAP